MSALKLSIALVTALGGVAALCLAWYGWRRRDVVSAKWFAAYVGVTGCWALLLAVFYLSPTVAVATVLFDLANFVSIPIPLLFLLWAATFSGYDDWLSSGIVWVLTLEFAAYAAFYATKPIHGIIDTPVKMQTVGSLTLPAAPLGGIEQLQMAFSLVVVAVAFGLLVRYYVQARNLFRRQAGVIILGTLFPTAGIAIFAAGLSPHPGLHTTALAMVAEGAIVGWALFRYDFLEVAPVASDLLVEELPDPVLVFDRSGRLVDHNPAAIDLFAPDSAAPIGTDDLPTALLEAMERGDQYHHAQSDSLGTTDAVFEPISTDIVDQRDVVRGRLVLLRDVTHQQRRQRTLAELQTVTRQFMTAQSPVAVAEDLVTTIDRLLDHPYSAVLEQTPDGGLRSLAVSSAVEAELGTATVEVPPAHSPNEGDVTEPTVVADPDLGEVLGWDLHVDTVLVLPLGDHGLVTIGAGPEVGGFTDEQRRFASILTNAAETAMERADREAELRESRELLERRNEQLEFFNNILRHDILNGLTVVQGNATLLAEHVDEEGAEQVEIIQNWSSDMSDLTKQIRGIVTTLQTSENAELEAVPLGAIVREKIQKVQHTYDQVTIDCDVDDVPSVLANDLLEQVVENLLMNAVEHHHGEAPRIEIRYEQSEDEVRLHIADDGPGIPADLQDEVFEPEYTTDDSETFGYGLYFVGTMVEAYGGSVRFEDSDLGGAESVVTLQRAEYE